MSLSFVSSGAYDSSRLQNRIVTKGLCRLSVCVTFIKHIGLTECAVYFLDLFPPSPKFRAVQIPCTMYIVFVEIVAFLFLNQIVILFLYLVEAPVLACASI